MQADPRSRESTSRVRITYPLDIGGDTVLRELPFVLGVLADLLGPTPEAKQKWPLRERQFIKIDRDNFENVLRRYRPTLRLNVQSVSVLEPDAGIDSSSRAETEPIPVELAFECMDDFEPESVARQIEPLRELLDRRQKLLDLRGMLTDQLEDAIQRRVFARSSEIEGEEDPGEDVLAHEIANRTLADATEYAREHGAELLAEFFRLFSSGTIPLSRDVTSMIEAHVRRIDEILSRQLCVVMHAPEFQQLEAAWRGLEFLVSRTSRDSDVVIRVLHITKQELKKDLARASEFDQAAIFKKVYTEEFGLLGGQPFAALIGDFYVDHGPDDMVMLQRMSEIAAACHAPFLTGASPKMFYFDDFTDLAAPRDLVKIFYSLEYDRWNQLRSHADSRFLGLVLPRMLLRAPYGNDASAIGRFELDEQVEADAAARLLWGNSVYAFAGRLAEAFDRHGWCAEIYGMQRGGLVRNLPVHRGVTDEGDVVETCPTEIAISDRRRRELERLGFIPLCHYTRTNMAVFVNAPSCHRPELYDNQPDTDDAFLAAQLEYTLSVSRFMHYLASIVRDREGSFTEAEEYERFLNEWIQQYVSADRESLSPGEEARFPLSQASVRVRQTPRWWVRRNSYEIVVSLTPCLQLGEREQPITTSMTVRIL